MNLQECIDSVTGVVLVSEVQPGSYHVLGTVKGTDVVALIATPAEVRSLFYS